VKPPPAAALPSTPPPPRDVPVPSTPAGAEVIVTTDGEGIAGPDDDTAPLPVILPDRMPQDEDQLPRMRDPFEPIERSSAAQAASVVNSATSAKMDQIKDLYLTAEAIGEDALARHFQQVSDRQRELIREYFDHVAGRGAEGQREN